MIHPPQTTLEFNQTQFALDVYSYRTEHLLSRQVVADILGVAKGTVASFEGKIRPRVDVFFNVCKMMGKEVSEYFKTVEL